MRPMTLDAAYEDMKIGEIVGNKLRPEFLPQYNLKEPVRAGD